MCYCGNTGVEWILKSESAQKVDPGEENSPTTPAETWTQDLSITSPSLYHWAIPAPQGEILMQHLYKLQAQEH